MLESWIVHSKWITNLNVQLVLFTVFTCKWTQQWHWLSSRVRVWGWWQWIPVPHYTYLPVWCHNLSPFCSRCSLKSTSLNGRLFLTINSSSSSKKEIISVIAVSFFLYLVRTFGKRSQLKRSRRQKSTAGKIRSVLTALKAEVALQQAAAAADQPRHSKQQDSEEALEEERLF